MVGPTFALPGSREGLAGARTCPNRSVVGPVGESEGVGPAPDAGKEMGVSIGSDIVGRDLRNGAFVHVARRDLPVRNQGAQPCGGERVVFVVVDRYMFHGIVQMRFGVLHLRRVTPWDTPRRQMTLAFESSVRRTIRPVAPQD